MKEEALTLGKMDQKRGQDDGSATPAELIASPGGKGVRHEEGFPKIKEEPLEEDHLPTSADEAREELDDEEDGDFVVDEDGIEYYEDEAFRIKQVSSPLIVNRTMKDLYCKCLNLLILPLLC
jgi:hypothetical protein